MCWNNLNNKKRGQYLLGIATLFFIIIASCDNDDEYISTISNGGDINWYITEFREVYYKLQKTWTTVPEMTENEVFTVDNHYILKNGSPFEVRGMVYVPGYPGYIPWEIENEITLPTQLTERIDADLKDIKAMGANTIRFWHAPKYCYEAVRNTGGLYILQTIWIEVDPLDFQDANFKESMVYDEVVKTEDDLSSWLKESEIPIRSITESVTKSLQKIYSADPKHKFLVDSTKARSLADPWVIAHALDENVTVVTKEEKITQLSSKKIKIPNVCDNMGVRWMNDFEFVREIGIRFSSEIIK